MYILEVTEQKPTDGGSIYCECRLVQRREDGTIAIEVSYGRMYFVCNSSRRLTQCFCWMYEYKDQLKKLGYKL
jgi:hypothetical protein